MRVALLGGSFDPLHLGHLLLASELLWRHEPDALWLLPGARHAFDKALSPFADRLEMARIGARLLGPKAEARSDEDELVRRGGDGSTISLVRHLIMWRHGGRILLWHSAPMPGPSARRLERLPGSFRGSLTS